MVIPYGFKSRLSHHPKGRWSFQKASSLLYAAVAELADALDSGSSESNFIRVQVPSAAPNQYNPDLFPIGDGCGLFVFFDRYETTYFRNGVKRTHVSWSAVSHHLRTLLDAEILSVRREGSIGKQGETAPPGSRKATFAAFSASAGGSQPSPCGLANLPLRVPERSFGVLGQCRGLWQGRRRRLPCRKARRITPAEVPGIALKTVVAPVRRCYYYMNSNSAGLKAI